MFLGLTRFEHEISSRAFSLRNKTSNNLWASETAGAFRKIYGNTRWWNLLVALVVCGMPVCAHWGHSAVLCRIYHQPSVISWSQGNLGCLWFPPVTPLATFGGRYSIGLCLIGPFGVFVIARSNKQSVVNDLGEYLIWPSGSKESMAEIRTSWWDIKHS